MSTDRSLSPGTHTSIHILQPVAPMKHFNDVLLRTHEDASSNEASATLPEGCTEFDHVGLLGLV